MSFPKLRPRRLRSRSVLRALVKETRLSVEELVQPLFVKGYGVSEEIPLMPGQRRYSMEDLVEEAEALSRLGIRAVLIFGIPKVKDEEGTSAYSEGGVVQRALRGVKESLGNEVVLMTDVCLCQYTSHGHCGVLSHGEVDNDATLQLLGRIAVSHARAGADIVAPSAMMDGQVRAIRGSLDESGFDKTGILAYSAKFASAFFGPFRGAADSAPSFGDRRGYQMDPANAREALREVGMDVEEGADIIMVKPALPYLDIIERVRRRFDRPLAAYQVSGEYTMIKAGAERGLLSEKNVVTESLTSMKRAGADLIISYFAKDVAGWLKAA
ncbi:MAG: porphobilinogen synthase [Candidatus Geothermarchaeales archaeon]